MNSSIIPLRIILDPPYLETHDSVAIATIHAHHFKEPASTGANLDKVLWVCTVPAEYAENDANLEQYSHENLSENLQALNDSIQWEAKKFTIQCRLDYVKRVIRSYGLFAAEQRREKEFNCCATLASK